ncbi:diguanylate cyclase [Pseudonocardiaceae bacterium YIM PH 21723]|nr:diguanylate cyclase [Pseudonocardiaceae bacterium YIM PH 21723]
MQMQEWRRDRDDLAEQWTVIASTTTYVPKSRREVRDLIGDKVDLLIDGLLADEFNLAVPTAIGEAMVHLRFIGQFSLQQTVELLGSTLLGLDELRGVPDLQDRVLSLLGALATGYTEAQRQDVFTQQERMKTTLLYAKQQAERSRHTLQVRFREFFAAAPLGVLIADVRGNFLEANFKMAEILGYDRQQWQSRGAANLLHPTDAEYLRAGYQRMMSVGKHRLRDQHNLIRADEEQSWAYVVSSVLSAADGTPEYFMTIVEDSTDLQLLQNRINALSLHDSLTGLTNRQAFISSVDKVIGRADDTVVTLAVLDIDGLTVVNDGYGQPYGDRLLQVIANRLLAAVTGEKATVARLGGDEFAILIEDSPNTPGFEDLAELINTELEEPVWFGDAGLALSTSIGFVRKPAKGQLAGELVREAHIALRAAECAGKRQWGVYDPVADADRRPRWRLAAGMPGALENGEIGLRYEPLVQLADGEVVAIRPHFHWEHPEFGCVGGNECAEMAEWIGLTLPLSRYLLSEGCRAVQELSPERVLAFRLPDAMAAEPDLVRCVHQALSETELPPYRLALSLGVNVYCARRGDVDDNMRALRDIGVYTGLAGFTGGLDQLAAVAESGCHSVRLTDESAQWLYEARDVSMAEAIINRLRKAGAQLMVGGVDSKEQASWWTELGVVHGCGPLFGLPAPLNG